MIVPDPVVGVADPDHDLGRHFRQHQEEEVEWAGERAHTVRVKGSKVGRRIINLTI
jgi:hypothetical protein